MIRFFEKIREKLNNRTKDISWVQQNKPAIHGIVAQDDGDRFLLVRIGENGDFIDLVKVSKQTRLRSAQFAFSVGDEINVYAECMTMSLPPQVFDCWGMTLVHPAAETEFKGWEKFLAAY